jgi:hypothetical protein
MADHVEASVARQQRFEHAPGDELGHGVRDADGDLSAAPCARAPQHGGEFQPLGEDLVGVGVGDPSELGRHEAPPLFLEQRALQLVLEQLDLAADGLRGDVQRRRRCRDAAFAHHAPEVQQVGVVEMAHGGFSVRSYRIVLKE